MRKQILISLIIGMVLILGVGTTIAVTTLNKEVVIDKDLKSYLPQSKDGEVTFRYTEKVNSEGRRTVCVYMTQNKYEQNIGCSFAKDTTEKKIIEAYLQKLKQKALAEEVTITKETVGSLTVK